MLSALDATITLTLWGNAFCLADNHGRQPESRLYNIARKAVSAVIAAPTTHYGQTKVNRPGPRSWLIFLKKRNLLCCHTLALKRHSKIETPQTNHPYYTEKVMYKELET
ncbi:hypothetical protein NDU88_007640 [Pleurodeles waltl]|uniref:Uncharacterized protein n=1 Tax=Pleurodeles waltl TaxID=8319 RepID=A0AAV7NWV5_PLEWA|nr:hypothetical protein NDU88_007640 [Pleurodeles waltl]